jgi:small subunit ribosomal protein S17
MPETTNNAEVKSGRKILVGEVVSTKMTKTIVVQVTRQRAHPLYQRVMSRSRKFYAHDEEQAAHVGDFVRIEETRPLSRLKRWNLKEIVKRSKLAPETGKGTKSEA